MIEQLLERFRMSDCNAVTIPMCPSNQLSVVESADSENVTPYRSLIGALLFLAKLLH